VDGESLTWSADGARYRYAGDGMLADFIEICTAKNQSSTILAYAQKWSVLGICEHGLPCSHNQYAYGLDYGIRPCLPMLVKVVPAEEPDVRFSEPIRAWIEWSRMAKALLSVGLQLRAGKAVTLAEWSTMMGADSSEVEGAGLFDESVPTKNKDLLKAQRQGFAWKLDDWMLIGQVRPRVSWKREPPGWNFGLDAVTTGPNLFGLLALYIANEVTGSGRAKAFCTSCGKLYDAGRRLNQKRANYCPQCRGKSGKQAAWRDASRRYRAKRSNRSSE